MVRRHIADLESQLAAAQAAREAAEGRERALRVALSDPRVRIGRKSGPCLFRWELSDDGKFWYHMGWECEHVILGSHKPTTKGWHQVDAELAALPHRIRGALWRAGFHTTDAIRDASDLALVSVRGLGIAALPVIRTAIPQSEV